MLSSRICIVPRSMSRFSDGAKRSTFLAMLVITALLGSACQKIEGRNGNRKGNRLFREMQFVDAAAEYEKALKLLGDSTTDPKATAKYPVIHYNLALAYSKMYRPGYDKPILLG